ncbi:MAG: CDP-diacylglycerol--serine O-phosphatidyltransferase [Proteobacteria bacterium]|nr:CDP-diacylglycerol--serine O-phosphatidyltransferase [Pseudomonadota bacterium]
MTAGKSGAGNLHELAPRRRGVKASIYLLPNMITAASLFFGFLAIKFAVEGRLQEGNSQAFLWAAYAILAAAVCDGLDGSVARLTRTQSAFGVQLDSLCDMVSFGVAPAVVIYNFALFDSARFGLAACFIYAVCGALRLARFNVQSSVGKASGNFTGIPIPMAAMPLCAFIMSQYEFRSWTPQNGYADWAVQLASNLLRHDVRNVFLILLMFALALGMISTFEYISTKNIKLPRKRPFRFLAILLMLTVLMFTFEFTVTLSLLLILYCLHGPVMWLFFKRDRTADEEELFISGEEDEEEETHT